MNTGTALLVRIAVALTWVVAWSLYLYPDVKEEIEEKRYLHQVEKLHTPVFPIDCERARGVENRDFIREDEHPQQCWVTIPAFNALYPEIAASTDLAATLRMQAREELSLENWDGTPFGAIARAAAVVLGAPFGAALVLLWRGGRRSPSRAQENARVG